MQNHRIEKKDVRRYFKHTMNERACFKDYMDMLLQLHISERTGRGVPKITEVYGKGTYEFRENSIVVSIPFTRVSTENEDPRWTQDRTQDGTQEDSKGSSEDEKIKRILEFCQNLKGILEITEMLGYSGRKLTKKYVKPLVEQGRLR